MSKTVGPAQAGQVENFPSPQNREALTVRQLADAYMAVYAGRDNQSPCARGELMSLRGCDLA